jgi:hypothetical protein
VGWRVREKRQIDLKAEDLEPDSLSEEKIREMVRE